MEKDKIPSTETYFASPERTEKELLLQEVGEITNSSIMTTLLHSVGGFLAILDENRQILSINKKMAETLKIDNLNDVIGLRPGEALGCNFAKEGPGGCGTSKYCQSCGAAIAIVASLGSEQSIERNCYIEVGEEDPKHNLAFQVRAHPMTINKTKYILLFLQDITRDEERAALERTFFHDMNNLLQGLNSASDLLKEVYKDDKMVNIITHTSRMLIKEVQIQRFLLNNSSLDCHIHRQDIKLYELLEELESLFSQNPLVESRHLLISCDNPDFTMHTDFALLIRILTNMIINGLEASDKNDAVSLWTEQKGEALCFFIHNKQYIPEETALKVFQKNFTTKDESGRGLGTYSMKLLGEKILGGHVDFSTSEEGGTVFSFCLPL
jgi:signal transduction histidine kinase